jgi:hypothetical protein
MLFLGHQGAKSLSALVFRAWQPGLCVQFAFENPELLMQEHELEIVFVGRGIHGCQKISDLKHNRRR